jgi:hypothetical protein
MALAQQQRTSEIEVSRYKVYEEQRVQAELALTNDRPQDAFHMLSDLSLTQIPFSSRWRLKPCVDEAASACANLERPSAIF